MLHGKLVRDKVKAQVNESVTWLQPALRRAMMIAKMHEEVEEIARDPNSPSEYGDVLGLLKDLSARQGFTWDQIEIAEVSKRELKGGFLKGRFVYTPKKKKKGSIK